MRHARARGRRLTDGRGCDVPSSGPAPGSGCCSLRSFAHWPRPHPPEGARVRQVQGVGVGGAARTGRAVPVSVRGGTWPVDNGATGAASPRRVGPKVTDASCHVGRAGTKGAIGAWLLGRTPVAVSGRSCADRDHRQVASREWNYDAAAPGTRRRGARPVSAGAAPGARCGSPWSWRSPPGRRCCWPCPRTGCGGWRRWGWRCSPRRRTAGGCAAASASGWSPAWCCSYRCWAGPTFAAGLAAVGAAVHAEVAYLGAARAGRRRGCRRWPTGGGRCGR